MHRWLLCAAVAGFACAVWIAGAGIAYAASPDAQLLATYQPVTRFDPAERFRPSAVQSFVADSDLERLQGGSWVVADPEPEPGELPGPGTGVWRLNQDSCTSSLALGGLSCYAEAAGEGDGSSVVYGRAVRQGGFTILQYWLFYYDNVYSYFYPLSDAIWQAHEGDWEVVNVVLDSSEEPLHVGYSRHCRGARRAWADTPRWDGTHPISYVAVGSHANYFSAGVHPFDPVCVPPQVQFVLGLLGLPLPSDYTGNGELAGPPRSGGTVTHVLPIDADVPSWTGFDGFWGELQFFHAPAPIGTLPFGTSPQGPAFHAVWSDPLETLATWPLG